MKVFFPLALAGLSFSSICAGRPRPAPVPADSDVRTATPMSGDTYAI
jgi:hypothetical protein